MRKSCNDKADGVFRVDRWKEKYKREKQTVLKMEFKKFRNAFIQLPCQIIKTGRKIVYRLLSWNRWLVVFFRGLKMLRYPLRCYSAFLQKSRYVRYDICWPFENLRNEKDMTQRQLEATNLTSRPAGIRKLCPDKIADPIALKPKKTRLF